MSRLGPINLASPVNWQHPLNRDLRAWWLALPGYSGGATWRDMTGRYSGTLANMDPATDWVGSLARPGGMGALVFDGGAPTEQVQVGNFLTGANFSISVWCNTDVLSSSIRAILRQGGVNLSLYLWSNNKFSFYTGGSVFSTTTLETGRWYHVVATYNGTKRLYLDGIEQNSAGAAVSSTLNTLGIGGDNFAQRWDGALDDVRWWHRALSAAEVYAYYTLSRQGYPGLLNRAERVLVSVPAAGGPSASGAATIDAKADVLAVGAKEALGAALVDAETDALATGAKAGSGAGVADAVGDVLAVGAKAASSAAVLDAQAEAVATGFKTALGVAEVDAEVDVVATGSAIETHQGAAVVDAQADILAQGTKAATGAAVLDVLPDVLAAGDKAASGTAQIDVAPDVLAAGQKYASAAALVDVDAAVIATGTAEESHSGAAAVDAEAAAVATGFKSSSGAAIIDFPVDVVATGAHAASGAATTDVLADVVAIGLKQASAAAVIDAEAEVVATGTQSMPTPPPDRLFRIGREDRMFRIGREERQRRAA